MCNVQVKNETWALWSWYRNQDSVKEVGDQIYIVREPDICPVAVHQRVVNRDCVCCVIRDTGRISFAVVDENVTTSESV